MKVWIEEPTGRHRWQVEYAKLEGLWGMCLHEDRKIQVDETGTPYEQFRTLIHEATHAACPDLREEAVVRIEASIEQVLIPWLAKHSEDLERPKRSELRKTRGKRNG